MCFSQTQLASKVTLVIRAASLNELLISQKSRRDFLIRTLLGQQARGSYDSKLVVTVSDPGPTHAIRFVS